MVSQELTIELKEILSQEFGRKISLAQASQFGNALVNYVSLLTKMEEENTND